MSARVFVATSAPVGERCLAWAKDNYHKDMVLVDDPDLCEVFISVFYNKLISEEFITKRKKCLNFHAGILPFYRGSGTVNWTIINGEKETGVTLHEIDKFIDHGPIIEIQKIPIDKNDTAEGIFQKMEEVIFDMFRDWFFRLVAGEYTAAPQDHSKARLYSREDLQKAKDVTRFVRAYHLPGREQAYFYNSKGEKIHLDWNTGEIKSA